ncbi:hypothetical protein SARC_03133 [Sphaeroforma arctica JP610]|uniref:DUF4203 domain-containing protein n=1 Tax=Sphaeroforma arctica JP610 TaxID=667725 RepID=A0A0L0G6L3_9EUKA|nr:hypothetical protein SARC_03133 [Sphaeroforma arctica JP610]KNC84642.1 hypothetical protein SARC_03133 [Sphaeroforma arctica JP610]|eukprot:XP_014158544.1 hypothetical protein SARC_03133 [Sphaeroforma arctica JP610]
MHPVGPLALVFVGSIICFAVAADTFNTSNSNVAWAIACGVISTMVTGVILFLHFMKKDIMMSLGIYGAIFLVLWWAAGVAFTTGAGGPYTGLGNGYFGVWIAFGASIYYFFLITAYKIKKVSSFFSGLAVCCAASLIEFSVASDVCVRSNNCANRLGWAVAVGVISFVVCAIGLYLHHAMSSQMEERFGMILGGFLTVWWAFGAGFNTSVGGPFPGAGNGYFATWTAFMAAMYYFIMMTPFVRTAIEKAVEEEFAQKEWNNKSQPEVQVTGTSVPKDIEIGTLSGQEQDMHTSHNSSRNSSHMSSHASSQHGSAVSGTANGEQ